MVRIIVKGGVWRNTEDEILKAAVMKYGKNQWSRIASLLSRKSPKQCKERWHSWLDPSIKKTEWSREEEEKLLHLAKIFPTQWPTIAPLVGRTPSQCLQRYEKLLSAAQGTEEEDAEMKRLRPGEVDMDAANKPARPDPVDMDEDEKEMLSEARARMANTVGKKAKRKAREKQLDEARRLASFQRKRELRAAGIEIKQKTRKRRGIDYNAEIPFQKKEPKGFYDTWEEKEEEVQGKAFKAQRLRDIDGGLRDDQEEKNRKKDKEKMKKKKENNVPGVINQLNKTGLNYKPKRSKLVLPTPQVNDEELENIVKIGQNSEQVKELVDDDDELTASSSLLGNYSVTPASSQPARTPMIKEEDDKLIQDAKILIAMKEQQTPLLAGKEGYTPGPDFDDNIGTPMRQVAQTPNTVLQTPARSNDFGATPVRSDGTETKTPARDTLGINQLGAGGTPSNRKSVKAGLLDGLRSLPAPKNDFDIVAPEVEDEDTSTPADEMVEDAAEVEARLMAQLAAEEEAELARRSKVLKRGLPRPNMVNKNYVAATTSASEDINPLQLADELLKKEMVNLWLNDANKYPLPNTKIKAKDPNIPVIAQEDLDKAAEVLAKEMEIVQKGMAHDEFDMDNYIKIRHECLNEISFIPSQSRYGRASLASNKDKLEALEKEYKSINNFLSKDGYKRAGRLDNKIKMHTTGYTKRELALNKELDGLSKTIEQKSTEYKCYYALRQSELKGITSRVDALQQEVNKQTKAEEHLQARYKNLIDTKNGLKALLSQ